MIALIVGRRQPSQELLPGNQCAGNCRASLSRRVPTGIRRFISLSPVLCIMAAPASTAFYARVGQL